MLSIDGRRRCWPLLALALTASLPFAARAGDADYEGGDDHDHGPSFLVEAKRTGALAPLEDVRVRAQVKDTQGSVVERTDADGRVRLGGFGDDVHADSVIVTCSKAGFRTVEVIRREAPSAKGAPVEVECLMEPG